MVDDERKIAVLKRAVLKLTREKSELEERVVVLTAELEEQRTKTTTRPLKSADPPRWRKLFGGGDAADSGTAAHAPGVDPIAVGELLRDNERVHVELFEQRKAFETLVADLKLKLREAEGRADQAVRKRDEAIAELSDVQAAIAAEHELLTSEAASLRTRLAHAQSQSGGACRPSLRALSLTAESTSDNASAPTTSKAATIGAVAGRLAICLDAVLLIANRRGQRVLAERLQGRTDSTGNDWDSSAERFASSAAAVHAALNAAISRSRQSWSVPQWQTEDPRAPFDSARVVLLLIFDNSVLIVRSLLLATAPNGYVDLVDDAATKAGTRAVPHHFDSAVADMVKRVHAVVGYLLQFVVTATEAGVTPAAFMDQSASRCLPSDLREVLLWLVTVLRKMLPSSENTAGSGELALCLQEVADVLASVLDPNQSSSPKTTPTEPSFLRAATQALHTGLSARHLGVLLPYRREPGAATPVRAGSPSRSRPPLAELTQDAKCPSGHDAPDPNAAEFRRWLRVADDQCVFWRNQFELALVELDERMSAADQRNAELVKLRSQLTKERNDAAFSVGALQRQLQLLSEQIVTQQESVSR